MASSTPIVTVDISISGSGVQARTLGRTLFMTNDETLNMGNRLQVFDSLDAVESTFATGTEPDDVGKIYFGQNEIPGPLMVGRIAETDENASIQGGIAGTLVQFQAITDGEYVLTEDGIGADQTALDFSTATNFGDILTILNAAIAGTFTYDGGNQSFNYTSDIAVNTLEFLTDVSPTTGTQIADLLGLSATTAIGKNNKIVAETLVDAFRAFRAINDSFYFVTVDVAYRDDPQVLALAQEIEAQGFYMLYTDSADENLTQFTAMYDLQLQRTVGNFQQIVVNPIGYTKYLSVSVASYMASTNFNATNGVKNSANQPMPLIQANNLSGTLIDQLNQINSNYYNVIGGDISNQNVVSAYFSGTTFKDQIYQDIRYNVDWLATTLTVDLTNFRIALKQLPRTASGQAGALGQVKQTLQNAVTFGMIAPGQLSTSATFDLQQTTGNTTADGFLDKGYTAYAPPLTQEPEINRANRVPVLLYFWAKSSGQINSFIIQGDLDL